MENKISIYLSIYSMELRHRGHSFPLPPCKYNMKTHYLFHCVCSNMCSYWWLVSVTQPLWVFWVSGHSTNSGWRCPTASQFRFNLRLPGFLTARLVYSGHFIIFIRDKCNYRPLLLVYLYVVTITISITIVCSLVHSVLRDRTGWALKCHIKITQMTH